MLILDRLCKIIHFIRLQIKIIIKDKKKKNNKMVE